MTPNMMCTYASYRIEDDWFKSIAEDVSKTQNNGVLEAYLEAAKKLTVYFSAEMAEAHSIVSRGRYAADYTESSMPQVSCSTESEKRSYENMRRSYMYAVRESESLKTAAADAQAFIDAANEILVSKMDAMRKNTFAHVHAYLSGVCSKNSDISIDVAQCFQDCLISVKEDESYVEETEQKQ